MLYKFLTALYGYGVLGQSQKGGKKTYTWFFFYINILISLHDENITKLTFLPEQSHNSTESDEKSSWALLMTESNKNIH